MANHENWKPYNNEPLREGEVLVPQLVDDTEYATAIGAKLENLRTWSTAGITYTVMFVPVPADQELICLQTFNAAVNEMLDEKLGPNRRSRCMIPQPDGARKPCPKVRIGNHAPCASCPHRDEYEREDRSVVSIDDITIGAVPSAESEALEKVMFDELVSYLKDMNPVLADVVTLGFRGFSRKGVVGQLPVKSSQAYDLYAKAERLTRAFLRG